MQVFLEIFCVFLILHKFEEGKYLILQPEEYGFKTKV